MKMRGKTTVDLRGSTGRCEGTAPSRLTAGISATLRLSPARALPPPTSGALPLADAPCALHFDRAGRARQPCLLRVPPPPSRPDDDPAEPHLRSSEQEVPRAAVWPS